MPNMLNQAIIKSANRSIAWDAPEIIAALKRLGWSLRQLSQANGLQPGTLGQALRRPYPRAERIIANTIGVPARELWPERYSKPSRNNGKRFPK
jgi:Ner family transcriptional regulator